MSSVMSSYCTTSSCIDYFLTIPYTILMAKKHHFLTLQRKTERNNFVQFGLGTGVFEELPQKAKVFEQTVIPAEPVKEYNDIYKLLGINLKTRKTSLGRSSKARNLEKPLETGAFRLHQVSVYCIICTLTLEQNSWQPPRNTLSKSARFPSSIKRRE